MKKLFFIIYLSLFSTLIFAQTDSLIVRIELNSSAVNDSEKVFIAGNLQNLGFWNPGAVELDRVDAETFRIDFKVPKNKLVEFKFTKGSWSTEALNDNGSTRTNFRIQSERDTNLVYTVNVWRDGTSDDIASEQITGTVEYIHNYKTRDELLPRDVIIWLPPGYEKDAPKRYPVLYMQDGQNIIDPSTSFLGIDWQIDETADSLIKKNIIEPIIIVGLSNTAKRKIEYSENDTGYTYIDFLVNDVKPMIDKKYRTKPDRENTAVAGSSMGGLISFMIAWEKSDVFKKAACLSPALKIRRYNFVDNVESYNGPKKDLLFYIYNGGIGLEDSLQTGIDEMMKVMENKGYKEGTDFVFYKDAGAEHNEAAWALRTWRFLELFFGIKE